MSRSRWFIAVLIAALGAALILAGWQFDRQQYLSSLLLQLGATLLLLLPLLAIERAFERWVEASEQRTQKQVSAVAQEVTGVSDRLEKTRQDLSDLQAQMAAGLESATDADSQLVARAKEDVAYESVAALFRRAASLRAISDRGLRVPLPGRSERLRFRPAAEVAGVPGKDDPQPVISLSIEDAAGAHIGVRTLWRPGQTALEALLALVENWKHAGSYPGDDAMQAGRIFKSLITTLDTAIAERGRGGDNQLDPLIEMVLPNWAMTDFGLEHRPDYYTIPAAELVMRKMLNTGVNTCARRFGCMRRTAPPERWVTRISGQSATWRISTSLRSSRAHEQRGAGPERGKGASDALPLPPVRRRAAPTSLRRSICRFYVKELMEGACP